MLGQQYYDWYYDNATDQLNQTRVAIAGPSGSNTWIYQLKNYDAWLSNNHYNFTSGSFSASATAWTPNSKQIYLYDVLAPSVNNSTNQPDAYLHVASSDYSLPYFSNGLSDSTQPTNFFPIYSQYVKNFSASGNILSWSAAYWDERPYPWYPLLKTQWLDCQDYALNACLNNETSNIDPTVLYNQQVNYNLLMTEYFAGNPYWVTLVSAMDLQWNNLFNNAVYELQHIRNVNIIENELKAANVRQMGFAIPDYGLQYYQYDSLMRYLGTFYLTRGTSNQFINFVSFFSQIKFNYIPLYANGLNYNTLTSQPTGNTITQTPSGSWIPTPYYDVSYDPSVYPNLNETLYRQLLVQTAPIYLVLRNFLGQATILAVGEYISSSIVEYDIETLPTYPYNQTLNGLSTLSFSASANQVTNVISGSGTCLGPTDSITMSFYTLSPSASATTKTIPLSLILSNRLTASYTQTITAVNHNWSFSITAIPFRRYTLVATDNTQVATNGTVTLNEVYSVTTTLV